MVKDRVAVVGAGLGGLSAALRLASKGLEVDVFESLDGPGGKANNLVIDGYRFDTGPSLLTLPGVFEQLFEEVGEDMSRYLRFEPLEVITRYRFDDGTVLDAYADRERFAQEVHEKLGEDPKTVLKYLDRSREIYDLTSDLFMFRSITEPRDLLSMDAVKALIRSRKVDAFRNMHEANSSWFGDKRTVQLFDRYATYNGSSPFVCPATFNLIQHVEYGIGAYGVKGGIYSISRALHEVGKKLGVDFHFGSTVGSILVENREVKGITVDGERRPYDIVVSNSDVVHTYRTLLQDTASKVSRRYFDMEPSSSGCVFYWGVDAKNDDLLLNNIFFSGNYEREFADIWQRRVPPEDPTVYVNITSKLDPGDAPEGAENWFVLVNVPYDSGQDWSGMLDRIRKSVLERVEKSLGRNIRGSIRCEGVLLPPDIEKKYRTNRGSIYGFSSNLRTSAFMRQPNRSRGYRGLFFCGGSAHPGGGMPLVLLSGKIAADLVCLHRGECQ